MATTARVNVVIVGGDPVIGRALEVLLQAAGYRTWFLSEPVVDKLDELLADSQLLLVAPALRTERRKALLNVVSGPSALVKIPVLELLLPDEGEEHIQGQHVVFWPCSMEELKRAINVALLAQE